MAKNILHMFFTENRASPFDVNMSVDAGYDVIVPHTGVTLEDIEPLIQDCIFSRPPAYFNHSGIFIGGRDVNLAAEMIKAAGSSMVKPFEVCVLADPNGAYTTSAALVALINKHLMLSDQSLKGSTVTVFGGGPVGLCSMVLAAQSGASVVLARLTEGSPEKQAVINTFLNRYGVSATFIDAQTTEGKLEALTNTDVIISSAKAGIEVLSMDLLTQAVRAKVVVDVNAVPPAGIAGVGLHDNGVTIDGMDGCVGVGALAIGNVKYKTQRGLLKKMQETSEAVVLDFPDAYTFACELVSE